MKAVKSPTGTTLSPYRIHHIALNVSNLQRSVVFYEQFIGVSVTERTDHSAKLSVGDDELTLFQLPSDIGIGDNSDSEHTGSLNHIAFEIPPSIFDAYRQRLIDNNVPITFGPVKRRHGFALYFLDPDGNKIELFYNNASRNFV
jgi:catechol 2,3-dioxygenase